MSETEAISLAIKLNLSVEYVECIQKINGTILKEKTEINLNEICNNPNKFLNE